MAKFAFKVIEVFDLTERLALITDVLSCREHKHGSVIELHRPDGSVIQTESWFEVPVRGLNAPSDPPYSIGISNVDINGARITMETIPIGTEVWLPDVSTEGINTPQNMASTGHGNTKSSSG